MEEKTNFDQAHFIEDPRYKQCNREALMGLGLGIANFIWWFVWGYGLGSRPPGGVHVCAGISSVVFYELNCRCRTVYGTGRYHGEKVLQGHASRSLR